MNWFYAINNQQLGPVSQPELESLVRQGVITPATLVWREGMAGWQAYSEIGGSPTSALPGLQTSGAVCSECGKSFLPDEVIRLGNGFVCAQCKPIATQKLLEGVSRNDSEQIRTEHLKHEASIKSVGILYLLGAIGLGVLGLIGLFANNPSGQPVFFGLVFMGLAALQLTTGLAIRRLKPWTRIAAGIMSGFGLLAFPVGTLINGYILYLLFSPKGKVVFSPAYQQIIQATPHIKYRTPVLVWVLVILIVVVIIAVAVVGATR